MVKQWPIVCTEGFKYSRDSDHCRRRIICDTLPARSHFSVTIKQRNCVWLALGKNPFWIRSVVGFLHCSFLLYSSNVGNFGTVPDTTVRSLRKTSFAAECREIINCVQDVLLVRWIVLKSVGLFGVMCISSEN